MRFIAEFFRDLRTPLYRNAIFLMANTVKSRSSESVPRPLRRRPPELYSQNLKITRRPLGYQI